MNRLACMLLLIVSVAAIDPKALADGSGWPLDATIVSHVETLISMPAGALPIEDYTRYYQPGFHEGHRTILGIFVIGGDRTAHLSSHHPTVTDGGCAVINVLFDVDTDQPLEIRCSGG